jgi:hypothetical protein
MSRHASALIFFGLYFSSHEEGLAFLERNNATYDSDSIEEESPEELGLEPLEDGSYILGFSLKPGESDAYARSLWEHRIDCCTAAKSHLHAGYA